jgi:predicted nuclease of restriction endonuclease-like (RecB) superfamily
VARLEATQPAPPLDDQPPWDKMTERRGEAGKSIRRTAGSGDRVRMPARGMSAGLPSNYAATLTEIKQRLHEGRLKAVTGANAALVLAYWDVGQVILERQHREGWGTRVIDRLSSDLREALPGMRGLSSRNLRYMRTFAAEWSRRPIGQQLAAQLPWFHHCLLLDSLDDQSDREWYAQRVVELGWSRNVLALQLAARVHRRQGRAQTNFASTLQDVEGHCLPVETIVVGDGHGPEAADVVEDLQAVLGRLDRFVSQQLVRAVDNDHVSIRRQPLIHVHEALLERVPSSTRNSQSQVVLTMASKEDVPL